MFCPNDIATIFHALGRPSLTIFALGRRRHCDLCIMSICNIQLYNPPTPSQVHCPCHVCISIRIYDYIVLYYQSLFRPSTILPSPSSAQPLQEIRGLHPCLHVSWWETGNQPVSLCFLYTHTAEPSQPFVSQNPQKTCRIPSPSTNPPSATSNSVPLITWDGMVIFKYCYRNTHSQQATCSILAACLSIISRICLSNSPAYLPL